ncbi:MAG: metallophosphoesterase [Chloroflexota bacterium]
MPNIRIAPFRLLLTAMVCGLLLAMPLTRIVAAQSGDPVLIGAGDIASCGLDGDEQTAKLLDQIDGTVMAIGDNVYASGSAEEFKKCYGPSWGRFKKRTRPAPGNHDYVTVNAQGYFDYFGKLAGPGTLGYYSYNLGAWHIVSLNSNIDARVVSTQGKWLRADLEANRTRCTLAYWHHPVFSSAEVPDLNQYVPQLWTLLYEYGVDVVVNGHIHYYERLEPLNPLGEHDLKRGIREFIVGTGGATLNKTVGEKANPNSVVRDNSTWGVIKFTLHPTSYDWEFIPVAGGTFHDSGSATCIEPLEQVVF